MDDELIVPFWQQVNDVIETEVLDTFSADFLQHPLIRQTAFAAGFNEPKYHHQLNFIVNHWGRSFAQYILNDEPTFGAPDIHAWGHDIHCSANSIQLVYHIAYWEEQTGEKIEDQHTILEWGGGYGAMARLILNKLNQEAWYVMYDTPTFAELQRRYLGMTVDYGPDIYDLREDHLKILDFMVPELIISTWALSESSPTVIEKVAATKAFEWAPHVLLAFQNNQDEFQAAGDIVTILNKYRYHPIENVTPVPHGGSGNWYASR